MSTQDHSAILKQLHKAAFDQRVAYGVGLWDRIPLGVAVQIAKAGIEIQDIDFSILGDPIILDQNGELHLCTTREVRPFRESDGNWKDG